MTELRPIVRTVVSSQPSANVMNSQPAGIGRVSCAGDYFLVNNLGRDISIFDEKLNKVAVFEETAFPNQDEESQFDLDAHGLFFDPESNLWFINHFGLVRVFDTKSYGLSSANGSACRHPLATPGVPMQIHPQIVTSWAGDVERFGLVWPYLLSSSPSGYLSPTQACPGLMVSEPLDKWLRCNTATVAVNSELQRSGEQDHEDRERRSISRASGESVNHRAAIRTKAYLEEWGILTGFAVSEKQRTVAVAAGRRVGCFALAENEGSLKPSDCLFEFEVNFNVMWIEYFEDRLLVAGPRSGFDVKTPGAWENLTGCKWVVIDLVTRKVTQIRKMDLTLAWGNGCEPLAIVSRDNLLIGFDRMGNYHAWNLSTGATLQTPVPDNGKAMGIAHAAINGDTVLVGYNRGGYVLHKLVFEEK
ncbi:MAG: hypothetical protein K2X93_23845 [Candidatus Obscuribacterales bacterium]|nr:hypothetical protein [Candidatus Obscuribacterales bacterium]